MNYVINPIVFYLIGIASDIRVVGAIMMILVFTAYLLS